VILHINNNSSLSGGAEVDFVVEKKPEVYPFEITYEVKAERKKIRNLSRFLSEEPKASWGFYVYRGEFKIDQQNRICFLPAWAIGYSSAPTFFSMPFTKIFYRLTDSISDRLFGHFLV